MSYYIIVFKNTFDAMAGEEVFKDRGYDYKIMPTPTLTVLSCGICLRVEDENIINKVIDEKFIEFKNIFKREGGEFKLLK